VGEAGNFEFEVVALRGRENLAPLSGIRVGNLKVKEEREEREEKGKKRGGRYI
jgi:hypothetical protein